MAVLATLKKDRLGEWPTLAGYLADLRRRETNSVAALAVLLSSPAEEQREVRCHPVDPVSAHQSDLLALPVPAG